MLPLAGSLALKKSAREGEGAHRAGCVIDRWRADLDWVDLLGARGSHDARGGLNDMVISSLLAPHPVLPKCRNRAVDEARVDLSHRFIAQPQRLECAGTVVLDQHV